MEKIIKKVRFFEKNIKEKLKIRKRYNSHYFNLGYQGN